MTKEFNLSEKEGEAWPGGEHYYIESDIKEFIKRLKEEVDNSQYDYANLEHVNKDKVMEIIDKLAGSKLI